MYLYDIYISKVFLYYDIIYIFIIYYIFIHWETIPAVIGHQAVTGLTHKTIHAHIHTNNKVSSVILTPHMPL